VPDKTWGEVGRAFIVVSGAYDEANLVAFLEQRLARYKLPRSIIVIDELPLTAIGKIDKKVLEKRGDAS
jgi:fatty-acyl-CoA synthase